jgi:hypothetical protein
VQMSGNLAQGLRIVAPRQIIQVKYGDKNDDDKWDALDESSSWG